MLGTGGKFYEHEFMTADDLWDKISTWDAGHRVMNALCKDEGNGLIGNHTYSLISTHILTDGTRLVKVRNPWGRSEWTGAFGDADEYWDNNPQEA